MRVSVMRVAIIIIILRSTPTYNNKNSNNSGGMLLVLSVGRFCVKPIALRKSQFSSLQDVDHRRMVVGIVVRVKLISDVLILNCCEQFQDMPQSSLSAREGRQ